MSMEKVLKNFIAQNECTEEDLKLTQELMLEGEKFENDKITKDDWTTLFKKCEDLLALGLSETGLKEVEVPSDDLSEACLKIKALDICENPELKNLDFLQKFPNLVSLTLFGTGSIESVDALEKQLGEKLSKTIEILDLSHPLLGMYLEAPGNDEDLEEEQKELVESMKKGSLYGCKDLEELHAKCFEKFPNLIALNHTDRDGVPLGMGDEENEEMGFGGMFEEEGEEEIVEEDEEEPAAKRAKTE